jgi:anionic cell wall polymer biosynthesis LytR-Cps2A-Psr (LCP) family protein
MKPPRWDDISWVNIAFFGLCGDDGQGEGCPTCTDTIMVLTVDPVTKIAGILSISRDMWVNIPGEGYSMHDMSCIMGRR